MSYPQSSAFLSSLIYDSSRVNEAAVTVNARYIDSTGAAWEIKAFKEDPNGYQGAVFKNVDTGAVVLVNRGTEIDLTKPVESIKDVVSDAAMGVAALPSQFSSAENLLTQAIKVAGSPEGLLITGHSLGGSISQYLGAIYGITTETFNAYGVGNILAEKGIAVGDISHITNHVMHYDPVSVLPGSKMVGTTLDYKSAADQAFDTPLGHFLALYGFNSFLSRIAASHGIGNFQDSVLASQPGSLISIDIANPIAIVNNWFRQFADKFGSPNGSLLELELGISPTVPVAFAQATTIAPARRDPLILDLDNNGLDTTGIDSNAPILFDHDGDGIKTATGWIKASDGFLVLDRNGNGTIDNGAELFGDATPLYAGGLAADGFAALAQEDTNLDGKVDSLDARFATLRLWTDLNQDGVSQAGELFTLAQKGVAALIVAKTENAALLGNGNQIADLGGFIRTDGSGGTLGAAEQLADVDLASNPFFSEFTDSIPLTAEAQALPDMKGAGQVRSLQQAASLATPAGSALATQLAAYASETTRSGQMARLDSLIKAWADTSTMATTTTGAFAGVNLSLSFEGVGAGSTANQAWLDKLSILERFNGQTFLPVPAVETALAINFYSTREALLNQSYQLLGDSVYGAIALQTRLKPYLDSIELKIDDAGIALDYKAMTARLDALKTGDAKAAVMDLVDLHRFAGGQLAGWTGLDRLGDWANDAEASEQVMAALAEMGLTHGGNWFGGPGDDFAAGSAGADQIYGNGGNDVMLGLAGNDWLEGGDGNDLLDGGQGNDTLTGGAGNDTYVFRRGDGNDSVRVNDSATGKVDTLRLDGLTPDEVRLEKWDSDLAFVIKDTGEWTKIQGFFIGTSYQLDAVQFGNGSTWDRATLIAQPMLLNGGNGDDSLSGHNGGANTLYGNGGNDGLFGGDKADQLVGGTGNDGLYANAGDDTLLGEAGNDWLEGGDGNDLLDGGTGNDTLTGGTGSDTFVFRRGDGNDSVRVNDSATGKVDTLRLDGLTPDEVRLEKWDSDLVLS